MSWDADRLRLPVCGARPRGGSTHPLGCFCSHSLRFPFVFKPARTSKGFECEEETTKEELQVEKARGASANPLSDSTITIFFSTNQQLPGADFFFFFPICGARNKYPPTVENQLPRVVLALEMWLTVETHIQAWEITPVGFTLRDLQRQFLPPPPGIGRFCTPLTFPTSGCLELQLTNPSPSPRTHADAHAPRQSLCCLTHLHFFPS